MRKDLGGLRGWDRWAPGGSREERLTIDDAEPDAGEGTLVGEKTVPEVVGIVDLPGDVPTRSFCGVSSRLQGSAVAPGAEEGTAEQQQPR